MKHNEKLSSLFVITALSMMAAASANAATELNIAYDGAYSGNITWFGTTEDVYYTAFSASYLSGDPLPTGTSNPFITFCLDISQNLKSGTWTAQTFAQANGSGTGNNSKPYVVGGLQEAASIYNANVGGVDISTATGEKKGAALQLAIWSALYGSNFSYTGVDSSVTGMVATMLATPVNNSLASTFWNATDPADNQDLIGPQMSVPEPATYGALAGAGLLLVALRSQFQRKQV